VKKIVRILSIDGGGIRGIIPAVVLDTIEKRTGKRISELFDIVAGTSTGGILALGLVTPDDKLASKYSAEDLMRLYQDEGPKIFKKSFWRTVFSLRGLLQEKYNRKQIEDVLQKYFGESTLRDALTDVIITGYEIERRISWFFKSSKAGIMDNYNFLMRDVARSTSAAPTYFAPSFIHSQQQLDTGNQEHFTLVDGGLFANNPALCGYVEGLTKFPDADGFMVVSLGTGEQTKRVPFSKAKNWGLASWAQPMLGMVFDGVSDTVDYQLNKIIKPMDKFPMYFRLQVTLSEVKEDLDEASPENIRNLKLLAEDLVRERKNEIELMCEQLVLFSKK
jgi:uncharacterized protein